MQKAAFLTAKRSLREAGVLVHFDPKKPLKLECDASPHGIGAVLFHTDGSVNRPIGFRSRTLTKAERNYSQLEREALALVFGVSKFRDYLAGHEFTLVTDHQPLLGLLKSDRPTPPLAAARIQRWALYLGGFRYRLQYCPGKLLINSDALSRLPQETNESEAGGEPADYLLALETFSDGTISLTELKRQTAIDHILSKVVRYVLQGWPASKAVEADMKAFFDRRLELSIVHDLLYWSRRVVIPEKLRARVLEHLHETHQGSSAMKAVARSSFWWPGLDSDIERLSASCKRCIQNLPMPSAAPARNWPKTEESWERVHADFAGPVAGTMILVLVDAHSKWIEAVPMKRASTSATVSCLRNIFCRFGIPRTIVTDNGTQFTSEEFATFTKRNNVTHVRTPVYHPQSNGLAERAVRTIKDGLRKMGNGSIGDNLDRLLFNYRRTPLSSGKCPSELLLGYRIRSRLDALFPPIHAGSTKTDEWTVPADVAVHVRNYGQGDKWTPGRTVSVSGARMVTIDTPEGPVRRHVDQVRSAQSSPEQCEPIPENKEETEPSTNQVVSPVRPPVQGPTQDTPPADAGEVPLRRSKRQRKPPQRLYNLKGREM